MHGIVAAIEEVEKCKKEGVSRTVLFNWCGHRNFDMKAYDDFFDGKIVKYELSQEEINASIARLNTLENK